MSFAGWLLGRLALVAFGYGIAVLVSVIVAEALLLAPTALPDAGR